MAARPDINADAVNRHLQTRPARRLRSLLLLLVAAIAGVMIVDSGPAAAQPAAPEAPAAAPPVAPPAAAETEPVAPAAAAGNKPVIDFSDPWKLVQASGPLIWPILFCSVLSLTIALERLIHLRRGRVIPSKFVRRLLTRLRDNTLTQEHAFELCQETPSPMSHIVRAAIRHWGRPTAEIQAVVNEAGMHQVAMLKQNLRILQGSANAATLLGLLGTVLGMIQAFNEVAAHQGLGRAEVLAAGISQALLTTAEGLVVAIPTIVFYTYLAGQVERLAADMNIVAMELIDRIADDIGASIPYHPAPPMAHEPPPIPRRYPR